MATNMSDINSQQIDKTRPTANSGRTYRSTTETLRLETPRENERTTLPLQAVGNMPGPVIQKKKASTFQITSVTSRTSNDGGEDSADDTEDISDILDPKTNDLDQETPSFSEDYSKSEEVFFGPPPTIPTSNHYGITALVQQPGTGGMMTAQLPKGVTVNLTATGYALSKADGESDDLDNWQNRFKIVKIDSNEPVKRGRWMCLDFMDSPAVSASNGTKKDNQSVTVNSMTSGHKDGEGNEPQTVIQMPVSSQTQSVNSQQHSMPVQYPSSQATGTLPIQTQQPSMPNPSGVQYSSQVTPMGQGQSVPQPTYMATTQAPVHPSSNVQTMQQAPPSVQQPPSSQSNLSVSTLPPTDLQKSQIKQVTQQNIMPVQTGVPTATSISESTQHQATISSTNVTQQQGLQTQNLSMTQQTLPHGVMNQGLPSQVPQQQPTMVNQQCIPPQTTHPQQVIPPSSVSSQSVAPIQQLMPSQQATVSQTMQGTQQIPNSQNITSQQMQNAQMVNQTNIGASQPSQQLAPSASSSQSVTPTSVAYTSHPNTSGGPTPATTPAQPQTHMNIPSGQQIPSENVQQASQAPQQQSIQPSQIVGIPDGLTKVEEIAAAAANIAQNTAVIEESDR